MSVDVQCAVPEAFNPVENGNRVFFPANITARIGSVACWITNPALLPPASVESTCAAYMNEIRWARCRGDSASMISRW